MPVRKHKPTTPGRRFATWADRSEVTKAEPEKSLTEGLSKSGGRNSKGRVTSRHRGGGAKRRYRKIDFKRRKDGVPAKVAAIEYDPNRSAHIALLHYADGEKRYILAPARLRVGASVMSGDRAEIQVGNCLPIRTIPTGTTIHNVELTPGRGGQLGRSAGTSIQLMAMVIIGGTATLFGPVIGSILILLLPAGLSYIPYLPPTEVGSIQQMIYGLAMVLLMVFRPGGLWGFQEQSKGEA